MTDEVKQNGWNEYSRLVLNEIKRLDHNQRDLEDKVSATDNTKAVVAVETLAHVIATDVKSLNAFKAQAIGVFAVVQILFGAAVTYLLRTLG